MVRGEEAWDSQQWKQSPEGLGKETVTHSKSVGVATVTLGTGLREQGERSKGQTRAPPDLSGRKLMLSCPPASRRCFPLVKPSQKRHVPELSLPGMERGAEEWDGRSKWRKCRHKLHAESKFVL